MASNYKQFLEFSSIIARLKHLKRTGWVLRKFQDPETVSGHMYRMAVLTFLLDDKSNTNIDKVKCMKMSLIHDLAESIIGDITPLCKVPADEKQKLEMEAMRDICKLAGPVAGPEILSLFCEYEEKTTPEAQFVKELDLFDMIHQAFEYERDQKKPGLMQDMFDRTNGQFHTTLVKGLVDELIEQRDEFLKQQPDGQINKI